MCFQSAKTRIVGYGTAEVDVILSVAVDAKRLAVGASGASSAIGLNRSKTLVLIVVEDQPAFERSPRLFIREKCASMRSLPLSSFTVNSPAIQTMPGSLSGTIGLENPSLSTK